ncbi:MAG: helix-turn-helix domain-containing protein [Micropruina sp.]|nr:MAG: helix-turn-helix domain-containing protein [Micropruina sp.]
MTAQPRPSDRPSEFLTITEAAARYHVSRDYIRHRIIDGALPAVRSGKRIIRVNSLDLERLFRPVQSMRSLGVVGGRE